MPYVCSQCGDSLSNDWCEYCEVIADHVCEIEYGRSKSFEFGEKGRSTKIEYHYCDECGYFEII